MTQTLPPQAEISNGPLHATLYLPDAHTGFYRGTRFDWSGVIASLTYKGHDYYGPWFTKTDPKVIDFVFDGNEIVAGPCSAITGPVEEFSTQQKALGYDDAKPGGTFIKIGVGVLRKPDHGDYNPYTLYEIVDGGKWNVQAKADAVEFSQDLADPASGYGYRYTKTVRLIKDRPEMTIESTLKNTGRRRLETSVYDHNFLVLDKQPVGPGYVLKMPFAIQTRHPQNLELAEIKGNQFSYHKTLAGRDTVAAEFTGYGKTAADYHIEIDNHLAGAGLTIQGDRPLSQLHLWSIRSIMAIEPFIDMSIEPGGSFSWRYSYSYRSR